MTAHRAWIERLARLGFAVKGIVYLLLGWSALQFTLGEGGRLTDARGTLADVLAVPYGRAVVGLLALGLALYAAWRFIEAFADANHKGTDASGVRSRAMSALSGAVYGLLAVDAARLVWPRGGGTVDVPAILVNSPLARWMLMLVALGLIGYGAQQVRRAFAAQLSERLNMARIERDIGPWPLRVSRIGLGGRGVVLVVLGIVLFRRIMSSSVNAATQTDSGDSLRLLAALPTGDWLLAGVAAGLMGYGVFQLVQARYRTITPP